MIKRCSRFLFAVFLIGMLITFAGGIHPFGDSLAVFRFWIAVGLAVTLIGSVSGMARVFGLVALILTFAAEPLLTGLERLVPREVGRHSIYQKNLWIRNPDLNAIYADIGAHRPDFVALQELSDRNMWIYNRLSDEFTSAAVCVGPGLSDMAVLSVYPRTDAATICDDVNGMLAMQVQSPSGPVWLVSIHLRWPWPHDQPQNLNVILPILEGLAGPVLIGGDLNSVPWSFAARSIRHATNTSRIGPVRRTYVGRNLFLRVPIDHIFVPGGGQTIDLRPAFGSDHLGLYATFDL